MQKILAGEEFDDLLEKLNMTQMDQEFNESEQIDVVLNFEDGSKLKRKKRKSNNTAPAQTKTSTPKPKKKKQLLDIEKAGDNLELIELELQMRKDQEKLNGEFSNSFTTGNTSSLLVDSLNLLNEDLPSQRTYNPADCICDSKITSISNENEQLKRKIEVLEQDNIQLWSAVNQIKENITWLYYNKQTCYSSPSTFSASTPHYSSPSTFSASATSAFVATPSARDTDRTNDSDCFSSGQNYLDSGMQANENTAPDTAGRISHQDEQQSCSYTKEQLSSMIAHIGDFCKASKLLFRRLYKEEEYIGRTLTGHKANSKATAKPAIADKSKLQLIYEVIQQKWPFITISLINGKIAEILKPCRNKDNKP